jgi:hypothetical protein
MIQFILSFLEGLLYLSPRIKRKRERRKEWSGTVEAKKTWTLSRHAYLVIFRTASGFVKSEDRFAPGKLRDE